MLSVSTVFALVPDADVARLGSLAMFLMTQVLGQLLVQRRLQHPALELRQPNTGPLS